MEQNGEWKGNAFPASAFPVTSVFARLFPRLASPARERKTARAATLEAHFGALASA